MTVDEARAVNYVLTHTVRYINELELRIDILKKRIAGLQDLYKSTPPSEIPLMKELEMHYSVEISDLNVLIEEVRALW